jgi:hypothetical protein
MREGILSKVIIIAVRAASHICIYSDKEADYA